tara:strand:- start:2162 stop:6025 length:3864 start_codon:yes stop_codon:yes gene_type:complete
VGIFKIQKELIELTSLQTHPSRSFSSGTMDLPPGEAFLTSEFGFNQGVTGSIKVVPRPSPAFKDFPQGMFVKYEADGTLGTKITTEPFMETSDYLGFSPYDFANVIKKSYPDGIIPEGSNISGSMYQYVGMNVGELAVGPMSSDAGYTPITTLPGVLSDGTTAFPGIVNERIQPARNRKKKEIRLFRPPYRLEGLGQRKKDQTVGADYPAEAGTLVKNLSGSDRLLKDYIRKVLMPNNTSRYTDSQFAYKNYHTLNFFTGSGFPDAACLIYNNSTGAIPPMNAPFGLDHPRLQAGWDKLPTHWSNEQLTYRESAPDGLPGLRAGRGPYTPTGSFTFEFYINPRYTNWHTGHSSNGMLGVYPFHAGTIMHMPTVFAVSLVSGSSVDDSGLVDGYRIMLQLSQSAEVPPRDINLASIDLRNNVPPKDLVFLSDDNSLKKNHWHYVGVRWGTERVNHGTGTFVIDGVDRGTFYVPSMSIAPQLPLRNMLQAIDAEPSRTGPKNGMNYIERIATSIAAGGDATVSNQPGIPDPDILVVGNFYEGPGTGSLCDQKDRMYNFFNLTASINEGIRPVVHNKAGTATTLGVAASRRAKPFGMEEGQVPGSDPTEFKFISQLNAEIHEIKIYDKYRSLEDIVTGSIEGPGTILEYSRSMKIEGLDSSGGTIITGERHTFNSTPADTSLLFYLPPFFVKESPNRSFLMNCVESFKKDEDASAGFGWSIEGKRDVPGGPTSETSPGEWGWSAPVAVGGSTGITTPELGPYTEEKRKWPIESLHPQGDVLLNNTGTMLSRPFNAGLSLSVDATLINLENFTREFIGGIPAIPDSYSSDAFNYTPGNYPRLMHLTASSVSQKFSGSFSRYGLNIGRVNSIQQEINDGNYPLASSDDPDSGYPNFGGHDAIIDGKFLTPVSGALDHFYATGSLVRRNLALLPNDNGLFAPNFGWLMSGSVLTDPGALPTENQVSVAIQKPVKGPLSIFVDDEGALDLTLIGLQNLFENKPQLKMDLSKNIDLSIGWERSIIDGASWLTGTRNYNNIASTRTDTTNGFRSPGYYGAKFKDLVSPDNPDGWAMNESVNGTLDSSMLPGIMPKDANDCTMGASYDFWIYQTTGDPSSNEIKLFDISNLFYGQRIEEGTFRLRDPYYTGSNGKVSITLRDNGEGGLYRADCLTKQAQWANVGNVFYDEGVGIIKSPHIGHFGKDYFSCDFAGEQTTHVMTVNAFSPGSQVNSSSNPSYLPLSATLNANDTAPEFTYITSINIHDDNLNVIMRANLAQPVLKRWVDEYLFKIKLDF